MIDYTKANNAIVALGCCILSQSEDYTGPGFQDVAALSIPIIKDIEPEMITDCQECASKGAPMPMLARKILYCVEDLLWNNMPKESISNDSETLFWLLCRIRNEILGIYPDVVAEIDEPMKEGRRVLGEMIGFDRNIEELMEIVRHRERQNEGHTEPTRDNNYKSTDRGVNGRETASNDAIPEWLPECIPAEDYKTQQNIDGNRWFGTLVELALWLEPFVYNGTTHRWELVDCLFEYRGKGREWKPATRTDLASAFDKVKNSNRYELQ